MAETMPQEQNKHEHNLLRKIVGVGAIATGAALALSGNTYWELVSEPILDARATIGVVGMLGGTWLLGSSLENK